MRLDNAYMNHEYRPHLLVKISGVILIRDKDKSMKALFFKWLGMRGIYLMKMDLGVALTEVRDELCLS